MLQFVPVGGRSDHAGLQNSSFSLMNNSSCLIQNFSFFDTQSLVLTTKLIIFTDVVMELRVNLRGPVVRACSAGALGPHDLGIVGPCNHMHVKRGVPIRIKLRWAAWGLRCSTHTWQADTCERSERGRGSRCRWSDPGRGGRPTRRRTRYGSPWRCPAA